MSLLSIHRMERSHVVRGDVPRGIRAPGPVLLAPGARVMGDLHARGEVHLGRGASVAGDIHAIGDVILGAGSSVAGDVRAEGGVRILGGAIVTGAIDAAGDVRLAARARVGTLHVGGDLHVTRPVFAPKVRVAGETFVEPA